MGNRKKFRITERDFLVANRKAAREEEIREHGKQIIFRSALQRSRKTYSRKNFKKTGISDDDLSFFEIPCQVQNNDAICNTLSSFSNLRRKITCEIVKS